MMSDITAAKAGLSHLDLDMNPISVGAKSQDYSGIRWF